MNDHYYDCTEDVRKNLPLPVIDFDTGPRDLEETNALAERCGRTISKLGPGYWAWDAAFTILQLLSLAKRTHKGVYRTQ